MRRTDSRHKLIAHLVVILGALCWLCTAPAIAGQVDPFGPVVEPGSMVASTDEWRAPAHADGELIVKLSTFDADAIDNINTQFGTVTKRYFPQLRIYLLGTDGEADEFQLAGQMASHPDIELAHPNYLVDPLQSVQGSIPIPDEYSAGDFLGQPAVEALSINEAHAYATGAYIKVAVIDGGVDFDHPALEGKAVSAHDYVDDDGLAFDEPGGANSGHGTFVAGIIHLVAPDAEIRAYRVSGLDGSSDGYLVAEAIMQAIVDGCQIVNLSLVTTARHEAIASAIEYAETFNTLVVAAAGNGQHDTPLYPASDPYVLAVGAVDADGSPAAFSNRANYVDVWAPGENIYSPYLDEGYAWWSGTSFAAPFVAGQAALIYSKDVPCFARDWVVDAVINTSTVLTSGVDGDQDQNQRGGGVINPLASLVQETPYFIGVVDPHQFGDVFTIQQFITTNWSISLIAATTHPEYTPMPYSVEICESASFVKSYWGDENLPGRLVFYMDATGLALGVYQDTILIHVEGAYNNPLELIYTLEVVDCTVPGRAYVTVSNRNWNIWGGDETQEQHFLTIRAFNQLTGEELNEPYTYWTDANPEFISNIQVVSDPVFGDGVTVDSLAFTFCGEALEWGQSYYDTIYFAVDNTHNSPLAVWFHCYVRPPDTMSLEWLDPLPGGSTISFDIHTNRYALDIGQVDFNAQYSDTIRFSVNYANEPESPYSLSILYPDYQDLTTYECVDISPTSGMTDDTVQVIIDWSQHTFTGNNEWGFRYFWWEVVVDNSLTGPWTAQIKFTLINVPETAPGGGTEYGMSNYPNPFNPVTTVFYSMPEAGDVRLDVYNIVGQHVRTLVDGHCEAGRHSVTWDGRDGSGTKVASGIYLYRIQIGDFRETKKMMLIK